MSGDLDERGLPRTYPFMPGLEIAPRTASERLKTGNLLLVDVRTAQEWSAARVAGAMHIPLHELPGRITEIDDGRPVAFLCHHGARSMKAAQFARANGCPDALSVAGDAPQHYQKAARDRPLYS